MSRQEPQPGIRQGNIPRAPQRPPTVPADPFKMQRLFLEIQQGILDLMSQRALLIQGVQRLRADNESLRTDVNEYHAQNKKLFADYDDMKAQRDAAEKFIGVEKPESQREERQDAALESEPKEESTCREEG